MNAFVVAVMATYNRGPEVVQLLASLQRVSTPLAVLVIDNANDPETEEAVRIASQGLNVHRVVPKENLGCGGGLELGERIAFERYGSEMTHLWLMDDDTEVCAGVLERLLKAMEENDASLACPMIVDASGSMGWQPGVLHRKAFRAVNRLRTPAEFLDFCARLKLGSLGMSWASGPSLLVTREAVEKVGFHRSDFWIRGEDIEWSLRVTENLTGIFVPDATVIHHARPVNDTPEHLEAERVKHGAMLQNVAYIALRLRHGRRIVRHLPGNLWRYVKLWGWRRLPDGLWLYWRGAVLGLPAGVGRD